MEEDSLPAGQSMPFLEIEDGSNSRQNQAILNFMIDTKTAASTKPEIGKVQRSEGLSLESLSRQIHPLVLHLTTVAAIFSSLQTKDFPSETERCQRGDRKKAKGGHHN